MTTNEEIVKTCENCKYEFEDMEGTHCRHCIHNAEEHFEPKEIDGFSDHLLNIGFTKGYEKGIDDFAEKISPYISEYQQTIKRNKCAFIDINNIAEQLKAGGKNDI